MRLLHIEKVLRLRSAICEQLNGCFRRKVRFMVIVLQVPFEKISVFSICEEVG